MLTKNVPSFLAQAFFLKTLGKGTNEQRCPFCLAFGIKEQRLLRDNTHPKVRRHGFAARNACSLILRVQQLSPFNRSEFEGFCKAKEIVSYSPL